MEARDAEAGRSLEAKPVSVSRVETLEMVLPNDANPLGFALGGRVLHAMDIAAAIAAHRHCGRKVVTASFDRVDFLHPVRVGQVMVVRASVNFVARTSMEVGVKVLAEDLNSGERLHTASAYTTFVALGTNGRPVEVPPLQVETDEDARRFREGGERRAQRLRELEVRRVRRAASRPAPDTTGG